ncbi:MULTISPECIES: hypothetical protein [Cyanophyceae]|uniref:AbiTii domain-containing protein n=1 Tax=Cyanophyceae TaxID=3028117 RepID=UPI0016837FBE|nr:hypothetical protein [Trichocoleus sp. FACHB-69]MBD1934161.1 hypothetical protein [Trichocoleus sp. FACHB-69]
MESLIVELQRDATEPSVSVLNLLRKALVVARKLRIQEFKKWIELELNGYYDWEKVPQYRFISGSLKAWNPCRGWIPVVATGAKDLELLEIISNAAIGQPISELQGLVTSTESRRRLHIAISGEMQSYLMRSANAKFEVVIHTDSSQVYGILEAVKDIVLNWSLQLEEDGIIGEGMTFSKKEKEVATSITYNIESFINQNSQHIQNIDSVRFFMSETFNNDQRGAHFTNFANKNQDNARQQAIVHNYAAEAQITREKVLAWLEQIGNLIREEELPKDAQEEATTYLEDTKKAIEREEPKKKLALANLESLEETLEKASKTVDAGQTLWSKVGPIILKVGAWLSSTVV